MFHTLLLALAAIQAVPNSSRCPGHSVVINNEGGRGEARLALCDYGGVLNLLRDKQLWFDYVQAPLEAMGDFYYENMCATELEFPEWVQSGLNDQEKQFLSEKPIRYDPNWRENSDIGDVGLYVYLELAKYGKSLVNDPEVIEQNRIHMKEESDERFQSMYKTTKPLFEINSTPCNNWLHISLHQIDNDVRVRTRTLHVDKVPDIEVRMMQEVKHWVQRRYLSPAPRDATDWIKAIHAYLKLLTGLYMEISEGTLELETLPQIPRMGTADGLLRYGSRFLDKYVPDILSAEKNIVDSNFRKSAKDSPTMGANNSPKVVVVEAPQSLNLWFISLVAFAVIIIVILISLFLYYRSVVKRLKMQQDKEKNTVQEAYNTSGTTANKVLSNRQPGLVESMKAKIELNPDHALGVVKMRKYEDDEGGYVVVGRGAGLGSPVKL